MLKLIMILFMAAGLVFAKAQTAVMHHHNKIDDIKTIKDIADIFYPLYGNDSTRVSIYATLSFEDVLFKNRVIEVNTPFKKLQALLNAPAWAKVDFDENGYTDILVTGHEHDPFAVCIMDSGNNRFFLRWLTKRSFQNTVLPVVASVNNIPAIIYYHYPNNAYFIGDTTPIESDTLVYKFGDFVEYNPAPKRHNITRLEYSTGPTFRIDGNNFKLLINNNRSAVLNYNSFYTGKQINITRKAAIHHYAYDQIVGLLDYINFEKLANTYRVNWSDDQTCTLKIIYDNGSVKTIEDYGMVGTLGLMRLYEMLSDLRLNQNWQPVKN